MTDPVSLEGPVELIDRDLERAIRFYHALDHRGGPRRCCASDSGRAFRLGPSRRGSANRRPSRGSRESVCLRSVGRVVSYLLIVAALAGVVLRGTALFDRVS